MQVVPVAEEAEQDHDEDKLDDEKGVGLSRVVGLTSGLSTKGIVAELIAYITTADYLSLASIYHNHDFACLLLESGSLIFSRFCPFYDPVLLAALFAEDWVFSLCFGTTAPSNHWSLAVLPSP